MVYTIVVHLYAKDSPESISKLHNKLLEASEVYSKDHETISWFVMQDHQNKRAFTIVERYEQESSQKYHLEVMLKFFAVVVTNGGGGQGSTYSNANAQNPYWKTFNPYVEPLLERPMDLRRFNELEEER